MINSYSYANDIGCLLRKPLFNLTANVAISLSPSYKNSIARIIKIAFHCFMAAIFVLPSSILWLAGKFICCLSNTKVAHDGLSLAPPSILLPKDNPNIDIQDIYNQFISLNIEQSRKILKKACLEKLCKWVKEENSDIYTDNPLKRSLFCSQVKLYLKGILEKMNSGKMQPEKKKEILLELAEASTRCWPTWLEVSAKLYSETNNQEKSVPNKLLKMIQENKECLILEFSQQDAGQQWHTLNFIRNILGLELGLNTTLNALDPYGGDNHPVFNKTLSKWLFLQRYEDVNRLVEAIRIRINYKPYDISYHDYLLKIVKESNIKNPEDYVANNFYDKDYQLTYTAVNLMLRSIGILK